MVGSFPLVLENECVVEFDARQESCEWLNLFFCLDVIELDWDSSCMTFTCKVLLLLFLVVLIVFLKYVSLPVFLRRLRNEIIEVGCRLAMIWISVAFFLIKDLIFLRTFVGTWSIALPSIALHFSQFSIYFKKREWF